MIKLKADKATKVRKEEAFYTPESEYGPMITLSNGVDKDWDFGIAKARRIFNNPSVVAEIKEILEKEKDYKPSETKKGKAAIIELTYEEQKAYNKVLLLEMALIKNSNK